MKIKSGILLDTGPLVAFLDKKDDLHRASIELFSTLPIPFRTCEPVLTEAFFLLRRINASAAEELLELIYREVFTLNFEIKNYPQNLKELLFKYRNVPISLADACLIRMAEIYAEDRIFTFDSDFETYRWERNKKFKILK